MKKFTIHYNYYATADVQVLADSEEDALRKARETHLDLSDYDFSLNEESVIDSEEAPDLKELIEKAEAILQKADLEETFFDLDPWPYLPCTTWDGADYIIRKELAESVFWKDEAYEIYFMLDNGSEIALSELPELQQLEICQAIIAQAESNGITL